MKNLAIIPARGGSNRIPGKNIKEFYGKPIIAYSIEAAKNSNLFDEIMVSTDDQKIAQIAVKCGAEVPFFRSEKNSNDQATLADVVEEIGDQLSSNYEYICLLLPTAPFIRSKDLVLSFKMIAEKKADSIISVVEISSKIYRSFKVNNRGMLEFNFSEYRKTRSQDLPDAYMDAGQFYWTNLDIVKKFKKLCSGDCYPFVIPKDRVQDIDTYDDWVKAELKFKLIYESGIK